MNPAILAEIRSTWDRLLDEGRIAPGTLRFQELSHAAAEGQMLVAIDDRGKKHLLVPVGQDGTITPDRQSRGVHILRRELEEDGEISVFLDVVCLRSELHELFDAVISEMVEMASGQDREPAAACRDVLDRWRDLLERMRPDRLGKQVLVGLFGELQFLRKLIEENPQSLSTWSGPDGGRHDFTCKGLAVEVKTSRSRKGWSCEVHGHEQLEPPPHGDLFVAIYRIEPSEDGRSVPELVDDILGMSVDAPMFLGKLSGIGFDLRDSAEYQDLKFHVLEERIYRVDEGFPKIVSSSFVNGALPSGVTYIRYGIELSARPPFPLEPEETRTLTSDLATGAR